MHDLVADGNSVVVVDHDVRVLKACDHLIEMGPVAGAEGGHVVTQGTVGEVAANPVVALRRSYPTGECAYT